MEMCVFMGLELDPGRCLVSAPSPAFAHCPFQL